MPAHVQSEWMKLKWKVHPKFTLIKQFKIAGKIHRREEMSFLYGINILPFLLTVQLSRVARTTIDFLRNVTSSIAPWVSLSVYYDLRNARINISENEQNFLYAEFLTYFTVVRWFVGLSFGDSKRRDVILVNFSFRKGQQGIQLVELPEDYFLCNNEP